MTPRLDALCLGESMLMVTPEPRGGLALGPGYALHVGGAESNVAMYLAALGCQAAWASRVGADPLGDLLVSAIEAADVDVSLVERSPTRPTGVFFKLPVAGKTSVHYYRRGSAASAMGPDFADRVFASSAVVTHLSGVTAALSASCLDLLRSLLDRPRPPGRWISFDVNYRPALWERDAAPILLALARQADVVFVGLDEAHALWRVRTVDELAALLPPSCVLVVKNGAVDATTVREGRRTTVPARQVRVVDSVGAGDAFAAGWLAGALRGLSDEARLRLGHFVASTSLGTVADVAPLPPVEHICEAIDVPLAQWSAAATRLEGAAPCP